MNTLQEFTTQIFRCLQTFTIYDPFIAARYADTIEDITGNRPADADNPYFYHLQGKMFNDPELPEFNDEVITIPSLDPEDPNDATHQALYHVQNPDGSYSSNIVLTRDAINAHPVTKMQYLGDMKRISMLIDRHILSSDYIKNCFYGIDITFNYVGNVDFKPFELLNYGSDILEPYEEDSIIDEVRVFLEQVRNRWVVSNYMQLELYAHDVFNSILWTVLPIVMIKKRIDNLHTARIHSSLLWEYLIGCGLGDYRDVLTRDQQLFLYKNIKYLLYNRGTSKTLRILADNLLSPYSISLNEKRLLSSMQIGPEYTVGKPLVVRRNILDTTSVDNKLNFEQYADAYGAEAQVGLEPGYGPELLQEQEDKLKYATLSSMPTKLLEFNAELCYDISVLEFIRFAIETSMYLTINNKLTYNASILFLGTELIVLSMKEAFALLMYAFWMSEAPVFTLTDKNRDSLIGKLVLVKNSRVLLTEKNIDAYMDSIITVIGPITIPSKIGFMRPYKFNPDLSNNEFIKDDVHYTYEEIFGSDILQNRDSFQSTVSSKEDLLDQLNTLFDRRISDIHKLNSNMTTTTHYAMDFLYNKLLYREVVDDIALVDATGLNTIEVDGKTYIDYEEWFSKDAGLMALMHHLDNSSKMHSDYEELAKLIIDEIVKVSDSKYGKYQTLTNLQFKAMRKLFIQLCSYDVVFLDTYSEIMDPVYIPQIVSEDTNTVHVSESANGFASVKLLVGDGVETSDPDPSMIDIAHTDRTGLVTADTSHDYKLLEDIDVTPESTSVDIVGGDVDEFSGDAVELTISSIKTSDRSPIVGVDKSDNLDISINMDTIDTTSRKVVANESLVVSVGFPKEIESITVIGDNGGLNLPPSSRVDPMSVNTGIKHGVRTFTRVGANANASISAASIIFDNFIH